MNLVQINERLKDLPMQVVQQYANGMNPEVPPYLALGELQRRELSQKQMATAQGAQQGPQPSIKEQVEQKAGLMQLQQMQQQQMAQQQAQPRGPMPTPAGVPQPEDQPEAMMASGGLARIPVRRDMFEYAGGGIVAFAEGGDTMGTSSFEQQELASQAAAITDEMVAERRNKAKAIAELEKKLAFLTNAGAPQAAEVRAQLDALKGPAAPQATRRADSGLLEAAKAKPAAAGNLPTTKPPRPAAPRPPIAAAPAPVTPQPGLPAAAAAMTPQDEVAKLALESVREKAKAMTPEEAMAQEGKFASQYGLDKKFGEEERGLLALMKRRQEEQAKGRPMEELGATLRGFGQGYGGASAAGERAARETYEMDMANQREMLNAINAINKENLATGKERYKSGSGLFGKSEESAAAANRERTQTLGQMRNKDIDAATAAANRLSDMERAKMDRAVRMAEINNPGSSANIRTEYLKLMDQAFALEDKGDKAAADALRRKAETRLTASSGASAGVGGERNDITRLKTLITGYSKDLESLDTTEDEKKYARTKLKQLRAQLENAESGGGGKNEATPLPENASAKNLVVGTVYQTAKGPAKWTGTGFMPI
jgi:hypothetical protein